MREFIHHGHEALNGEESGTLSTRHTLVLRPVNSDDAPFLRRLYDSTRIEELSALDWPDDAKEMFLAMQFNAQSAHYQSAYDNPDFAVVVRDEEPIGRLFLHRGKDEIRIVDISLLPEFRNAGIGSALLGQIFEEADAAGVPVTLHVENFNPALKLYGRLGFRIIGDNGMYHLLERAPERK